MNMKRFPFLMLSFALLCAPVAHAGKVKPQPKPAVAAKEPAPSLKKDGDYYKALSDAALLDLANGGDGDAMYWIGARNLQKQDVEGVVTWMEMAFQAGNLRSGYSLGLYYRDIARPPNNGKALEWFKKASDAGYEPATIELAEIYRDGKIVAQDRAKAVELAKAAVSQGGCTGAEYLGIWTARGLGVEKNMDDAAKWFQLAFDRGEGKNCLISANWLGTFAQKKGNLADAMKLYKLSADGGVLSAASNFVDLYLQSLPPGSMVNGSPNINPSIKDTELIKYFEMAVKYNDKNTNAITYLNQLYEVRNTARPAENMAPFGQEMGVATFEQVKVQLGAKTTLTEPPFAVANGWRDCEKSALFAEGTHVNVLAVPGLKQVLFCFTDNKLSSVRMRIVRGAADRILAGLSDKYAIAMKEETPPRQPGDDAQIFAAFTKNKSFAMVSVPGGRRSYSSEATVTYLTGTWEEYVKRIETENKAKQDAKILREQQQKASDKSQL